MNICSYMHSVAQQTATCAKENDDLGPVEIVAHDSIIVTRLRRFTR